MLILGGSSDGFAAAEAFLAAGCEVITSFAGRTETRRAPVGFARVGGFGGVSGLAAYLAVEDIALVVDATHPFAAIITRNAAAACAEVGAPLIHVVRPPWTPEPGDDWRVAADLDSAARMVPVTDGPCFLTVGRMKIGPFATRRDVRFLIRTVDPPSPPFDHPDTLLINDRGPFSLDAERALFDEHRIGCLVTANSGGGAAAAKLVAARERGVPVVVVDRPPPPQGRVVATVPEAVAAAEEMIGLSMAW
ncbi:cobalt-precorrin-6A reductase [Hansschlegelia zhihuaiae]|uniref:cobalt-precorrin-6A reductase n=1 Tax=Hansschlegelia zhihuaiae TaxID=405005 RepID=UPI001FDFC7CD|nr:cobalt-precorrin-6A reductase [Hansschlegelia zhihuaiae]